MPLIRVEPSLDAIQRLRERLSSRMDRTPSGRRLDVVCRLCGQTIDGVWIDRPVGHNYQSLLQMVVDMVCAHRCLRRVALPPGRRA